MGKNINGNNIFYIQDLNRLQDFIFIFLVILKKQQPRLTYMVISIFELYDGFCAIVRASENYFITV